jgi:uncharacterized protein YdiU (UPF0061 family)
MQVRRSWYDDNGMERAMMEAGAVGTRVAKSFLRFGQMELFFQRDEMALLRELAEHCLEREFSHLLVQHPTEPRSELFVRMFDEVAARQASLVAEWLRVGYCQGNLNSDNSALGGVTLDYGPFAFMERFNLLYNPWVGGGLPYSFAKQPQALATNLVGLAQAFLALVEQVAKAEGRSEKDINALSERVRGAVSGTFVDTFNARHDENCRAKLGLSKWDDEADALFTELTQLMGRSTGEAGMDFTLFFRALGTASAEAAAARLSPSAGAAASGDAAETALRESAVGASALQPLEQWPLVATDCH